MNIAIYKNNNFYRYGDILLHKGRWRYPRHVVETSDQYTGSILRQYLDTNNKQYIPGILYDIVSRYDHTQIKTCNNTLYINIRTGDVLQRPLWMAKYGKPGMYKTLTSWYMFDHDRLLHDIQHVYSEQINCIIIVSAMHFGGSIEPDGSTLGDWLYSDDQVKHNERLLQVICDKIYKQFNIPVHVDSIYQHDTLHDLTDKHFVHFINAKHVVLETSKASGFSKLIRDMRQFHFKKSK